MCKYYKKCVWTLVNRIENWSIFYHVYKKIYDYTSNTIILSTLNTSGKKVMRKTFYLDKYKTDDITEWADGIATRENIRIMRIPYVLFALMGMVGDFLKLLSISFSVTTFRLNNMTTDNIHDLKPIKEIAPDLPVTRQEGYPQKQSLRLILKNKCL